MTGIDLWLLQAPESSPPSLWARGENKAGDPKYLEFLPAITRCWVTSLTEQTATLCSGCLHTVELPGAADISGESAGHLQSTHRLDHES